MSSTLARRGPRLSLARLLRLPRRARAVLRCVPTSTWVLGLWFATLAALWLCVGLALDALGLAPTDARGWHAATAGHALVWVAVGVSAALSAATFWLVRRLQRLERAHATLLRSAADARIANRQQIERLNALPNTLHAPLASIRGLAELIQRRIEHPLYRQQAALIQRGAHQVETLLGEMVDQARADSAVMPLDAPDSTPRGRAA